MWGEGCLWRARGCLSRGEGVPGCTWGEGVGRGVPE